MWEQWRTENNKVPVRRQSLLVFTENAVVFLGFGWSEEKHHHAQCSYIPSILHPLSLPP